MLKTHRLIFTALLASVFAFVAGGCTLLPAPLGPAEFRAAAYVPAETWFFSTVTVRPSLTQMAALKTLQEAFTSQPEFEAALKSALDGSASGPRPMDLQKDVLPLMSGETATAVFGDPFESARYIMLIQSSDPVKLLKLLAPDTSTVAQGHKGATFFESGPNGAVMAAYRDWALVGQDRETLEKTIDRIDANGAGSLREQERYRSVVERLPEDKFAVWYLDTIPFLSNPSFQMSLESLPSESRARLDQAFARSALSFTATGEGIDMRYESIPDSPLTEEHELPHGDALAAYGRLPASTLAAAAGDNLPELLRYLEQTINAMVTSTQDPRTSALQLNFAESFAGEYALGLGRGSLMPGFIQPSGQPSFFLAARVADADSVEQGLHEISSLAPPESVQMATVAEQELRQFIPETGQPVNYGVVEDWLYVMSGDEENVLMAPETGGLTENERLKMVSRAMWSEGSGFFVDLQAVRVLIEELSTSSNRQQYEKEMRPFLAPFRAFGGSWRYEPSGDTHGQLFLAIRGV
jgi:hypothetical protein